jgi:hypothetical protein
MRLMLAAIGVFISPIAASAACDTKEEWRPAVVKVRGMLDEMWMDFDRDPRVEVWQEVITTYMDKIDRLEISPSCRAFFTTIGAKTGVSLEINVQVETWQEAITMLRNNISSTDQVIEAKD